MKRIAWILTLAGILGAGLYLYRPAAATSASTQNATAASAAPRSVVAAGRTEPASEEIDVTAEMDGRLRRVYVEEGQRIRRGQPIAELVNADFGARVEHARAVVAEREAALARANNGSRPMQRSESKAQIREAEAVLENADRERQRRATLLDRGAISRSEYDSADREYMVARARVDAAVERSALVEDEVRPEDRKRAAAELERARAQLAEAEALREKTVIRSPIDGIVLRKHKHTGESISPDGRQPIVTLGDTSRLRVRAEIDENDIARVQEGQTAYVTAPAYGEQRFAGRVVRVGKILGRKKLMTDAPNERIDTKVLETLIELDPGHPLPVGLRVDAFVAPL